MGGGKSNRSPGVLFTPFATLVFVPNGVYRKASKSSNKPWACPGKENECTNEINGVRGLIAMSNRYEVGGVLEDSRVIRLNEPLPYKEGPVKVVIEPLQPKGSQLLDQNRAALEALDRLLAEPEDPTQGKTP